VRLEPDGRASQDGYLLRHAYLIGDTEPIAAKIVRSGWATVVPYPLEHRHRTSYLQLQQQAMAAGLNLWQKDLLGAAIPWQPPGSIGPGYEAADPDLAPVLNTLYQVPTGRRILDRLTEASPVLLFRYLDPGVGGSADPLGNVLSVTRFAANADPANLATLIAHEAIHTIDFTTADQGLTSYTCFEIEQRSHGFQAQVWAELVGANGKREPTSMYDRWHNEVLDSAQRNDLANFVHHSIGYQTQCARDRASTPIW
jgi:hypothetical protein